MEKNNIEIFLGTKERLQHNEEYWRLFLEAKKASVLEGDFAELGVAQGSSAKMICEGKGKKIFHLFDTFEGLPEPEETEKIRFNFYKGKYKGELDEVKEYLKDYEGLVFHKGFFPDSALEVEENKFAFVHLDADLRKSTEEGLKFFYPRMVAGGIIMAHDFAACFTDVAFRNFFEDKNEKIEFLSDNQCLVRKV